MPTRTSAAISSEVATGRRMKGVEMLIGIRSPGSAGGLAFGAPWEGPASAGATCRPACSRDWPSVTTTCAVVQPLGDHRQAVLVAGHVHRLARHGADPAAPHRRTGRPARAAQPASGTASAFRSVPSSSRALTNWPGHSRLCGLGKTRLQLDRAGAAVDGVVGGQQRALVQLGLVVAGEGGDGQLPRPPSPRRCAAGRPAAR